MIRLSTGRQALLSWLGTKAGSWTGRARALTQENQHAGRHLNGHSIWSEVKAGLVGLQHQKCAYCERQLGSEGVEWSVDHFRPKGSIRGRKNLPDGITDVGGDSGVGYYLLAYDLDNFLVTCLTCNNEKDNAFPTGADRQVHTAERAALAAERPYLIHPGDEEDLDPGTAVAWRGPVPMPADTLGSTDRARALETIVVLKLSKEALTRDRVRTLVGVYMAYHDAADNPEMAWYLDALCAPSNPHSSCARYFRQLCETAPDDAEDEFARLKKFLLPRAR